MIYLDNAASAVPYEACMEQMYRLSLAHFANPGALHSAGGACRQILQQSRRKMAELLKVRDREVFFTSGGTEANNWAVKMICEQSRGRQLLVGATEHKSVLEAAFSMERQGFRVTLLYPDRHGRISPEQVSAAIGPDTALLCVQAVNNETGVVQDVEGLSRVARIHRIPFLCDAVQAFGHVDLPLHKADLITLSGHKFGGPKGIGCLIARYPYLPSPMLHGGGQELGLRSGTENLPAVASMAMAAELSTSSLSASATHMAALTARLLEGLQQIDPHITANADTAPRHPGILNCWFPGISAEELVMRLSMKGICVSPGAACAARDPKPSHVLLAMGYPEARATESVRFSLGPATTQKEIEETIAAVEAILLRAGKER